MTGCQKFKNIWLLALYLGRMFIYTPANPAILVPALLSSFIVSPLWYLWLGLVLSRNSSPGSPQEGPHKHQLQQ